MEAAMPPLIKLLLLWDCFSTGTGACRECPPLPKLLLPSFGFGNSFKLSDLEGTWGFCVVGGFACPQESAEPCRGALAALTPLLLRLDASPKSVFGLRFGPKSCVAQEAPPVVPAEAAGGATGAEALPCCLQLPGELRALSFFEKIRHLSRTEGTGVESACAPPSIRLTISAKLSPASPRASTDVADAGRQALPTAPGCRTTANGGAVL